ncbi:hypothetical protein BKA70DRAFT_1275079 [Coprinopsis sp. MPI-PUGE-AT-0042]|nr:hypothetical protein BKA70DRAFT_1275079 [Coprinopsis sp. MPI-PUGE-AT-0042]
MSKLLLKIPDVRPTTCHSWRKTLYNHFSTTSHRPSLHTSLSFLYPIPRNVLSTRPPCSYGSKSYEFTVGPFSSMRRTFGHPEKAWMKDATSHQNPQLVAEGHTLTSPDCPSSFNTPAPLCTLALYSQPFPAKGTDPATSILHTRLVGRSPRAKAARPIANPSNLTDLRLTTTLAENRSRRSITALLAQPARHPGQLGGRGGPGCTSTGYTGTPT